MGDVRRERIKAYFDVAELTALAVQSTPIQDFERQLDWMMTAEAEAQYLAVATELHPSLNGARCLTMVAIILRLNSLVDLRRKTKGRVHDRYRRIMAKIGRNLESMGLRHSDAPYSLSPLAQAAADELLAALDDYRTVAIEADREKAKVIEAVPISKGLGSRAARSLLPPPPTLAKSIETHLGDV